MLEGARAAGMSPAMLSLFPRREAHLVEVRRHLSDSVL